MVEKVETLIWVAANMKGGDIMKKVVFSLALMVALVCFSIGAEAKLHIAHGFVSLSFDEGKAVCSAWYTADKTSDALDATLSLYRGDTLITSWNQTGTGTIAISKKYSVQSGKTYTLILQYSVNGVAQPELSTTKTFPLKQSVQVS